MEQVKSFIKDYWIFLFICLIGLAFKFYNLGDRPLHHDESLHALYGKYFANSFTSGFYKYDPMLHGPLLYNIQGLWHWLAEPLSKAQVRFIPALIGFLISLSPLLFTSKLNKRQLLFLTTFLAISPCFTYWSRFLRHDPLVLIQIVGAIYVLTYKPRYWVISLGAIAGLHFSTKENFFVHIALILGFLITRLFITKKFFSPSPKQALEFLGGFFLVIIPLFSAWFQYWPGLLDGLYRKSLVYWLEQHHIERIKGPFFYNSLIISIYEIWILPTMILIGALWFKYQNKLCRYLDLFIIVSIFTIGILLPPSLPEFFITLLKIKNKIDFVLFFSFVYISLRSTIYLIQKRHLPLAFSAYIFFSTLFTYSFLGEKVPWLSIYTIASCAVFITLLIPKLSPKYSNIVLLFLFLSLPKTIYINYFSAGSGKELISQVHTTREYENILLKLETNLNKPVGAIKPQVLVLENNGWPLSWYLWGYNGVNYSANINQHKNYDFIFDRLLDSNRPGNLEKTHTREVINLRHYWWPSFSDITFKRWLKLVFMNEAWSKSGEFQISLWRKKTGFFSE